MKSIIIAVGLLSIVSCTYAQWNPNGAISGSIYYNNGNVGIGTEAPKEKFQIGDRWTFHNGGHKLISYNWYFSGGEKRIVDDEASAIRFTSEGDIQFSTAPYGLMNSTVAWQTPLFLANNGRVGLGNSSPQHALDVTNYFQANSESQLFIGQNHDFGANSGRYGIGLGFQHIDGTGQGKKYHLITWFSNTRTNVLTFDYQGNMGIGVTSPSQKLDLVGRLKFRSDNSASAGVWFTGSDGVQNAFLGQTDPSGVSPIGFYHGGGWQLLVSNDGNIGAGVMVPTQKIDINGRVKFRAKGASAGAWFTGSDGVQNAFLGQTDLDGTSPIGFYHGGHWRFVVANSGNIGIGTTNPSQKLEVKGTVYSTEVKVDVNAGTGPDYVFEPTYNLPTLAETEAYIKANKHLPEVPSAKEMEANGINLSEMNMLLLKKVEELTLHLIELKKENSEIKKENENQNQLINSLLKK